MDDLYDFNFDIDAWDEPEMGCTHTVTMYETLPADAQWPVDTRGPVIESFTTDDPYGAVEAAREAQATPDLEERLALEFEREMRDR